MASQNARRLARLSLSYSNRYLRHFEATHRSCLAALHHTLEIRSKVKGKDKKELFKNLTETFYT